MAFDKTKPADNQKIRLGPADSRDNFKAIVEGDDTFTPERINLTKQGADPAALANAVRVYVKDDALTNPELFARAFTGNVVQLTQSGRAGSTVTPFYMQSLAFDTTVTYTQANMVTCKGSSTSGGVGSGLFNCTVSGGGGQYAVAFTNAMANTNYQIMLTAQQNGSNHQRVACWDTKTVNGFNVTIRRTNQSSSYMAEAFDFMVIGGR